jgi:hypothetical protein
MRGTGVEREMMLLAAVRIGTNRSKKIDFSSHQTASMLKKALKNILKITCSTCFHSYVAMEFPRRCICSEMVNSSRVHFRRHKHCKRRQPEEQPEELARGGAALALHLDDDFDVGGGGDPLVAEEEHIDEFRPIPTDPDDSESEEEEEQKDNSPAAASVFISAKHRATLCNSLCVLLTRCCSVCLLCLCTVSKL